MRNKFLLIPALSLLSATWGAGCKSVDKGASGSCATCNSSTAAAKPQSSTAMAAKSKKSSVPMAAATGRPAATPASKKLQQADDGLSIGAPSGTPTVITSPTVSAPPSMSAHPSQGDFDLPPPAFPDRGPSQFPAGATIPGIPTSGPAPRFVDPATGAPIAPPVMQPIPNATSQGVPQLDPTGYQVQSPDQAYPVQTIPNQTYSVPVQNGVPSVVQNGGAQVIDVASQNQPTTPGFEVYNNPNPTPNPANPSDPVLLHSTTIHYGPTNGHKTLTGQVSQFRRELSLRYADQGAEDPYGGSVVLEGTGLDQVRDGSHVRVHGQIVPPGERGRSARFVVQSVEVLNR